MLTLTKIMNDLKVNSINEIVGGSISPKMKSKAKSIKGAKSVKSMKGKSMKAHSHGFVIG